MAAWACRLAVVEVSKAENMDAALRVVLNRRADLDAAERENLLGQIYGKFEIPNLPPEAQRRFFEASGILMESAKSPLTSQEDLSRLANSAVKLLEAFAKWRNAFDSEVTLPQARIFARQASEALNQLSGGEIALIPGELLQTYFRRVTEPDFVKHLGVRSEEDSSGAVIEGVRSWVWSGLLVSRWLVHPTQQSIQVTLQQSSALAEEFNTDQPPANVEEILLRLWGIWSSPDILQGIAAHSVAEGVSVARTYQGIIDISIVMARRFNRIPLNLILVTGLEWVDVEAKRLVQMAQERHDQAMIDQGLSIIQAVKMARIKVGIAVP